MRSSSFLGSLAVMLLFVSSNAAFAKGKPRITIEVVNSETSQRQYTYTTPGRKGTSQTNCNTNGTTNGTINDYGVGPIQTSSTGNSNTNCTTTTTAATPPQTYVRSITQEHVNAILPDGRQVTLWCQNGFRHCDYLLPGKYEAEIDGNSLFVYVHDLSGKEHRIKYKAVSIQEAAVAQQAEPETEPTATIPPPSSAQPSANSEAVPSAEGIGTLKVQAAAGDADAQLRLGALYEQGEGVVQDYIQAETWYSKAAQQGNAEAQFDLGGLYYDGKGVSQDYAQAAIWYRKAAEQGDADAQFNLGLMYAGGEGVPQDESETVHWFHKAAEQGLAVAQFDLGSLFDNGLGVPQDHAQAAIWYRKAAEQGNADAQEELGGLYSFGRGVPQDEAQAAFWYRRAAEQGDAKAQFMLGGDYATGQGVPQDYAEAYFWLDLAVASKVTRMDPNDIAKLREKAAKTRDLIASLLTPADLSRVQERARKWLEDHPANPQ